LSSTCNKKKGNPAVAIREREPASGGRSITQVSGALANLDEIRELIDLIIEKGVTELELERDGMRIKIARQVAAAASFSAYPAAAPPASLQPAVRGPERDVPSETARAASAALEGLSVVRSPMVGTFYASPAQGSEPFVQEGDRVQRGQVLCIIEAMKLMNEIEAEAAGEVIKCYVENGQPVEYGEPLFDIRLGSPGKRPS